MRSLTSLSRTFEHSHSQLDQGARLDKVQWDIKSFLQSEETIVEQAICVCVNMVTLGIQRICKEHFPLDPGTEALQHVVESRGGTMDRHSCTIRVTLSSKSDANCLATLHNRKSRFFEAFVHTAWRASRRELKEICQQFVQAGFLPSSPCSWSVIKCYSESN